jgi:hypothetical protein
MDPETTISTTTMVIIALGVYALLCAGAGMAVASEKHRGIGEGFLYGLLFGPIGVLIVACLPTGVALAPIPVTVKTLRPPEPSAAEIRRNVAREAEMARDREQWLAAREAEIAQQRKDRAALRAEKDEALRARGVEPGLFAWFKVMPDLAQALVMGLALAVPAGAIVVWLCMPGGGSFTSTATGAPAAEKAGADQEWAAAVRALKLPGEP